MYDLTVNRLQTANERNDKCQLDNITKTIMQWFIINLVNAMPAFLTFHAKLGRKKRQIKNQLSNFEWIVVVQRCHDDYYFKCFFLFVFVAAFVLFLFFVFTCFASHYLKDLILLSYLMNITIHYNYITSAPICRIMNQNNCVSYSDSWQIHRKKMIFFLNRCS